MDIYALIVGIPIILLICWARRVLEAKAERDAKMKRAMDLWEQTPEAPVESEVTANA